MTEPTIALKGIKKAFGKVEVLRGIDLEIAAAEVHALLGENGAGKSTLMRILLGLEQADAGMMSLWQEPYAPKSPREARERGVVMVPQERTLCPQLTVAENIVLGIEPTRLGIVRRDQSREMARAALAQVAGDGRVPLDRAAGELSVADQQLVEIARALAQGGERPRLLVLDEPTASLGKHDSARLFERVASLASDGLAIVLVTHFLADVKAHATRYTVLRDGRVQSAGEAAVAKPEQLVHDMLGRDLEAALGAAPEAGDRDASRAARDVLLDVRALGGMDRPVEASFELRRGEILGIAGLVGAGRTELLRMILGLDRARTGSLAVTAARGVGLLSEDRGGEGLMLDQPIADNIALSPGGPWLARPSVALAEGTRWIAELGIRASGPAQRTGDLSGGNQQKVQIARLLREDYDVLLVDEPTRGIDVGSKAQVLALLRELAAKGKGIVLVSSQLDELVSTCDRIAVLKGGRLGEARPASAWDEASLLLEAAS